MSHQKPVERWVPPAVLHTPKEWRRIEQEEASAPGGKETMTIQILWSVFVVAGVIFLYLSRTVRW